MFNMEKGSLQKGRRSLSLQWYTVIGNRHPAGTWEIPHSGKTFFIRRAGEGPNTAMGFLGKL